MPGWTAVLVIHTAERERIRERFGAVSRLARLEGHAIDAAPDVLGYDLTAQWRVGSETPAAVEAR